MRIVFMGTPDFAVPSLRALFEAGHEIAGVFCQPDRPQGRRQIVTACPVKQAALELGIEVFQFEKIRRQEGLDALRALRPQLCVTAAFGQILSQKNLDVPPLGTVNVHASLLPKYRGASPIQQAVADGERFTGVTTMYTERGVDCGDIILQEQTPIGETETAGELFERLAVLGAQLIVKTVALIEQGQAVRTAQDEAQATHCRMIEKADGLVDFDKEPFYLCAHVRGMNPWPVAFAYLDGQVMKIYEARPCPGQGEPGKILCADAKNGLIVGCKNGAVSIERLQMPGGKPVSAQDYLRGHHIDAQKLGGKNG
jgi:methionyl-tRNA formyltransferase